jgi:predicted O-methyltransferase YrrM
MPGKSLRRRVSRSPLAPVASFPVRAARVARHDASVVGRSLRWLFTSREHHNYTYHLTALNQQHLVWFLVAVTGREPKEIRGYLDELTGDHALAEHIRTSTASADRRYLADREVRYGRRLGWYGLIRALRPAHVVESGVDKGLGSCVIAAALLRNAEEGAPGRLSGLDINPEAGYLLHSEPWSSVVDLTIGDSLRTIPAMTTPIDLFLHDSNHSVQHERDEFDAVEAKLADGAVLASDNSAVTDVLPSHAERTGRKFLYFAEQPANHWFPGDGIGVAWT